MHSYFFHKKSAVFSSVNQHKMNNIQTLIVCFGSEITQRELSLFRGAVISAMENANILFHNHLGDNEFRYSYPLIQYKRIKKKAAIVCVGEGTEVIGDFFGHTDFNFMLGERAVEMEIDHINAKRTLVQVWNDEFRYRLRKWLPLSSDNYRAYQSLEGIVEQCAFLQKILIGNILSFCKGLGITVEQEIKCIITQLMDSRICDYKGVKMMSFDVEFKANISLPDYVGLGKGVSLGFGTVVRKHEKNNKKDNVEA